MALTPYTFLQYLGALALTFATVLLFLVGAITLFDSQPVSVRLIAGFSLVAAALIVAGVMFVTQVVR